ncbi:hypothetical protein LJR296_006900 [Cupriavidus necator]|uniref:hypothetical protein n=1 Tax=Cupriavidus necator TaxID=106590 RepID=UPI003ECCC8BD
MAYFTTGAADVLPSGLFEVAGHRILRGTIFGLAVEEKACPTPLNAAFHYLEVKQFDDIAWSWRSEKTVPESIPRQLLITPPQNGVVSDLVF